MYNLRNQLVDVLWFEWVMGIVKARDPITEQTKWYVWIATGEDEMADIDGGRNLNEANAWNSDWENKKAGISAGF